MPSDQLLAIASSHKTLEQIITWGAAQNPLVMIAEMIQQDEFTIDVIVPYEKHYLVYDVT